jgi:uncharacterized protein with GYD domain
MPRYLVQASYTSAAAAAFVSNPQDRVAAVQSLVTKLGAKMESIDFALGEYDVVIIATCPDDVTAAALALAATAPGHLKAYKTTKLLTPEEFLAAQKMARNVNYKGPSAG